MKTANVAAAKNELSRLLRRVRRGETVVITDRNRPVAKLVPIDPAEPPAEADVAALLASGALIPPAGAPLDVSRFLAAARPRVPASASLTSAVLAERRETR